MGMSYMDKQVVLPRLSGGVDHGATRLLLAWAEDGRQLVWQRSCKSWAGRMAGYQHEPGSLVLVRRGQLFGTELHRGGRLSKALLEQHAEAIDEFFGVEVTPMLHSRKTVQVGEWEPYNGRNR
jgi:hypothetical protein